MQAPDRSDEGKLLAVLDERTKAIQQSVKDIQAQLANSYVTRQEFEPVKRIVYGMVGVILVTVVGALLVLVLKP